MANCFASQAGEKCGSALRGAATPLCARALRVSINEGKPRPYLKLDYAQCLSLLTRLWFVTATAFLFGTSAAGEPFSAQITFGYGEAPPERWIGSVTADNARITTLGGWLHNEQDTVSLNNFELHTRHPVRPLPARKGLIIRGSAAAGALVRVSTHQGNFTFPVAALDGGREIPRLDGAVRISGLRSAEKLTDDSRFDDYPSVTAGPGDAVWIAWQSYSGRRDEIRVRKFDGAWRTFSRVPGVSGDVWRPQVALDSAQKLWVVWSQQVEGNFDIYARALDEAANQWGPLIRLSTHSNPDLDHHVIADSRGWLWVAWQGFRGGNSDIFVRYYDGSTWSGEVRVSDHPANDWEPQIAVDGQGAAFIVWDTYRNGNYDVLLRRFADGELGPIRLVAGTPKFEAHSSVAVDNEDRVWVAWDEAAPNWGKDSGPTIDPNWVDRGRELWTSWIDKPSRPGARLYESRRLNLAVFEGERRLEPEGDLAAALSAADVPDHDFPQLHADPASGRIALLFHRWNHIRWTDSLGFRPVYWEHAVIFYEGDKWSSIYTMPESWGRISARADGSFDQNGGFRVVWPTDGRLEKRPAREVTANIFAARLPFDGKAATLNLKPSGSAEAMKVDPVHPRERDEVKAIRAYRTRVGAERLQIVRGDLHRHTEFSWDSSGGMVDGSVFDFYRYMLDAGAMDFGAVTDHNSGGDSEYWWWLIEKTNDLYHLPGAYSTFFAYERSVEFPNGHRNVFHTRRGVPVVSFFTKPGFDRPRPHIAARRGTLVENDTKLLYASLRKSGGISIPHTPGSQMGTDWRDNDPEVEPVVEIFQGDRISYEHPGGPRAPRSAEDEPIGGYEEAGFLWSAYRKGYRLGTIASSDHWSTHISYAMAYTVAPSRESIFDAIKKRRTYGATDNIILDYRFGKHFMGDSFSVRKVSPLEIRAVGTSAIARVEVIRNGKIVYTANPDRKEISLSFTDVDPPAGELYYYVRVLQVDREIAWGSPIWISLTR